MLNFDTNHTFDGLANIPEYKLTDIEAKITFKQGHFIHIELHLKEDLKYSLNKITNIHFNLEKGSIFISDIKADMYNEIFSHKNYSFTAKTAIFTHAKDFDWSTFKINKISLHTTNINKWLYFSLPDDYIEIIKEIDNYKSQINIKNIQYADHKLNITDSFIYIKDKKKDDLYKLTVKGYINVEDISNNFDINEIKIIIGNLELLLCVLTNYPQSPVTVKLNEKMFFYQANSSHIKVSNPNSHLDFAFWFNMLRDDSMQDIFTNLFNKIDTIKSTYHGLWGIINNPTDHFYDDVFFRIFAMLDCITRTKSPDIKIPFSKKQKKEIRGFFANIIEEHLKELPNRDKQYYVIKEKISNSIYYSNELSYKNRIQYIITNYLSDEAKKIIHINSETLDNIVELRNAFAHLNNLPNFFYTEGHVIYNKTLLLIFYLLWKDLGISDKVIFGNLKRTFNVLKYGCNPKELDIYHGTLFIALGDKEFKKLSLIKHGYTIPKKEKSYSDIVIEKRKNRYSINVKNTKTFKKNINSKNHTDSKDSVKELYISCKYSEIKQVSEIWIENRDTQLKIHNVFIVEFT
ncbi:MAG: hypothetical protein FWG57_09210 [Endomicrobia bacterium]|nr:hypothetical protein [Endomicrobiia bacterium]